MGASKLDEHLSSRELLVRALDQHLLTAGRVLRETATGATDADAAAAAGQAAPVAARHLNAARRLTTALVQDLELMGHAVRRMEAAHAPAADWTPPPAGSVRGIEADTRAAVPIENRIGPAMGR